MGRWGRWSSGIWVWVGRVGGVVGYGEWVGRVGGVVGYGEWLGMVGGVVGYGEWVGGVLGLSNGHGEQVGVYNEIVVAWDNFLYFAVSDDYI